LIEKGVQINDKELEFIRFERSRPQQSINQLFGINKTPSKSAKKDDWSDALAAGLIIAGLAALISLLSGNGKK
jgi:hypothetical protein